MRQVAGLWGDLLVDEFTPAQSPSESACAHAWASPYWSLSKYLKLKVKRAVSYLDDFENAVAREAGKRGLQGAWSAATFTTLRCATSAVSCTPPMATGWRA